MEKNISETFLKIKDTVKGSLDGETVGNMKESGIKENNMEQEFIGTEGEKRKEELGLMEKGLAG